MKCEGWNSDSECHRDDAERRRQNTQYVDEERNWVTLCPVCWKANEEYWADMWSDYYSGCL